VRSRFAPKIEAALYYCCLEAIQNASKHAGPAAQTSIRLLTDAHALRLEVQDDGSGFDPDDVRDGVGLQNMRDRLGAVGGRVKIVSEPGHGTLIAAAVPLIDSSAPRTAGSQADDIETPDPPDLGRADSTARAPIENLHA